MEKQNVTLSLSKHLLQKAKIIAVKKNTSLSGLLRDYLTEIVKKDEAYQLANCTRMEKLCIASPSFL